MLLKLMKTLMMALLTLLLVNNTAFANSSNETTRLNNIMSDIDSASWVTEGIGEQVVYIFFDSNCSSCQSLYLKLRPYVASKQYQFRWIPVAIISMSSIFKATEILDATNLLATFKMHKQQAINDDYEQTGYIPTRSAKNKLKANEKLFYQLEIPVVPSILFTTNQHSNTLIQGSPSHKKLQRTFSF